MERIISQDADSTKLAIRVLSWITRAKRALSPLELQHALGVEVGKLEFNKKNLPEIQDMVSDCAGLVIVDEESDIIRLVHYTTQEYFKRTQERWFLDAKANLAQVCITYLSFDTFTYGFCPSDEEFETRLQSNPLYDYAARNWGHHIRELNAYSLNAEFLENKAKVAASSQALMAKKELSTSN